MISNEKKLLLSPYLSIYNTIIPKDNKLRRIKELVNFDFVFNELKSEYSQNFGRKAVDPVQLFKYLLLKAMYKLSDVDVVERSRYDMSFKYFLDLAPESEVIDASLLTKFRKLRLKNTRLLDLLIKETVRLAIEKGIIKSNSIIVDSTHTKSRYNLKSPIEVLKEISKKLRKSIYEIDESLKEKFPSKTENGTLEDEIEYCKELLKVIEKDEVVSTYPVVKNNINLLREKVEDDIENLNSIKERDAKVGHKTSDSSFFGFKTHIAMTEERIICGATITTGEKHDGKQLQELVEKSKEAGIKVKTIIGDGAYSEKENIEYSKDEEIFLVSKLSKTVTHGNTRSSGEFEFNKDAGMYVCKAGHLSKRKTTSGKKQHEKDGSGMVESYFFDVEKCKNCSKREGCYKEGAKTKSYSVSIKSNTHKEHEKFQGSTFFKEKSKERYKIEAKNSELKHSHGYDIALSSGLFGMEIQGAMSIFTVNLKRIIKEIDKM